MLEKPKNLRDDELLNVVDELLPHHYNEELFSQFYETATRATLAKINTKKQFR